jgi:hypothetical protein
MKPSIHNKLESYAAAKSLEKALIVTPPYWLSYIKAGYV